MDEMRHRRRVVDSWRTTWGRACRIIWCSSRPGDKQRLDLVDCGEEPGAEDTYISLYFREHRLARFVDYCNGKNLLLLDKLKMFTHFVVNSLASTSSMTSKYASLFVYLTPLLRHGIALSWPDGSVPLTLLAEKKIHALNINIQLWNFTINQ